ncbi:hypothetical protein D3C72_2511470 [compost metagenome]
MVKIGFGEGGVLGGQLFINAEGFRILPPEKAGLPQIIRNDGAFAVKFEGFPVKFQRLVHIPG